MKLGHNHLIDRELSWLDFDVRVLELAEDQSLPLLERVKFLSIFHSNMDEFFMVRVASLRRRIERGHNSPLTSGMTPKELLREIHGRAKELNKQVGIINFGSTRADDIVDFTVQGNCSRILSLLQNYLKR